MAKIFQKEIKEIARIIAGLQRASEESDPDLDKQLPKIEETFETFNKKYPKLAIKTEKRIDETITRVFIREQSVKKVFDDVASKLKGLFAIGLTGFDEANIQKADKFANIVNGITNSVFLTYTNEGVSETIVLEYNEKMKMVELNYEIKSIVNPNTPEYQLLEEYASKETDKSVNVIEKCESLGFMDIEDAALFEWEDEFYPKMLE
jgi:hypothetical protein